MNKINLSHEAQNDLAEINMKRKAISLLLALLTCLILAVQVTAVDTEVYSTPEAGEVKPDISVVLSSQNLTVDGKNVDCEKYNINGSNYFKPRDLAYLLEGSGSQFAVGYDSAASTVTITTGEAYTPAGGELATGVDNSSTVQPSSQAILIDGVKHDELTAYNSGGSITQRYRRRYLS